MEEAKFVNPEQISLEDKWDILQRYFRHTVKIMYVNMAKSYLTSTPEERAKVMGEIASLKTVITFMSNPDCIIRAETELQSPTAQFIESLDLPIKF